MRVIQGLSLLGCLLFSVSTFAYLEKQETPVCLNGSAPMTVDNQKALHWKFNTKNQFKARAFVQGTVTAKPWISGDHSHFIISIGSGEKDTLEIIYNLKFGKIPDLDEGDEVTVCGEYITSYAKSGRYDASPAGALIHWVHYNPGNRSRDHEHGFIVFEQTTLIGFDDAPKEAWSGRVVPGTTPEGDRRQGPTVEPSEPEQHSRPRTQRPRPRTQHPRRSGGSSEPSVEDPNLPEICRHVSGRCS